MQFLGIECDQKLSGLLILKQGLDHEPSLDAGRDRFFQTCEQNGFPHNLKVKIDGDCRYQKVADRKGSI